MVKTTTTSSTC